MLTKIGRIENDTELPHTYGDAFIAEGGESSPARLRIGVSTNHSATIGALASTLAAPYSLLYVLHTSRTNAPLGRYQSPLVSATELRAFLGRFGDYLEQDARHDFWIHSEAPTGTIVLDRCNLIYAYGPVAEYRPILEVRGVQEVAHWAAPSAPDPRALHYHGEWDGAESEMLRLFDWHRTPLQVTDVQHWSGPQAS